MTKTPPKIDFESLEQKINDPVPIVGSVPPPPEYEAMLLNQGPQNGNGHAIEGPPVPRIGQEAAANMTRLSEAAAADIRRLGELAAAAGKRVQEECEQMARDVEANGNTIALHLTGLSQLLADVGMSNRETMKRLLGGGAIASEPKTEPAQRYDV